MAGRDILPLKVLLFIFIAFNLFLGSWYVLHGDLVFSSDVARDFFLYREVSEKKFILIGPHASGGLFHGPLWIYLNYPAFLLGHGNPLAVGWYWIFLIAVFLVTNFYLVKSLFGKRTAYLFVIFEGNYLAFHGRLMNNPHGAMFTLPAFFFFFVRYWETGKWRYLLLHLLFGAIIVQFQIAVGIPFLMLSFIALAFKSFQTRRLAPLLAFLLLAIPLGNFIIFDLRHNFLLSKLVVNFVSPERNGATFNYLPLVYDRLRFMFSAMEIVRLDRGYRNPALFLFLLALIYRQIRDKKYKTVYFSFLYFYVGFFALSFIDKGPILYFYLFPLFPLVHLIWVSMWTSRYKLIFGIVFIPILIYNLTTLMHDDKVSNFIGTDLNSWKFLSSVASRVYAGPETDFGYFVFSPDTLAYQAKYAMLYAGSISKKKAFSFQKKPVTYLVIEPHRYFKSDWWKKNKVHLDASPVMTLVYPNGYRIEKYELTPTEIKITPEPDIDPGLSFR